MKPKARTRDVITQTLHYVHGKTVDLGAGTAKYKSLIKPRTSDYVTFDIIPGPNIDIVGDILNLPFETNTFDTIISTQVLEHVTKPWVMIKETFRVLKPGGTIILSAPFLVQYHADPYDYFRYTKEGMKGLFIDTGFEVLECEGYGSFFSVLSEMIHFTFFNPYKNKKKNSLVLKFLRSVEATAAFLDRLVPIKGIYPNVYIVARKK